MRTGASAKGRCGDGRVQRATATQRTLTTSLSQQAAAPSTVPAGPAATSSLGPPRVRARPPAQQASTRYNQNAEPAPRMHAESAPRMHDQNVEPVIAFLKDCGLQLYATTLLHAGFDEMETLHAIAEPDMWELGIPPYHVARLQKALRELRQREGGDLQANLQGPVVNFLQENGLGQYASLFMESGFDEIETLLEVDDIDLKDLGLPRGHALKLKRHLHEYQANLYAEEPQPVPVQRSRGIAAGGTPSRSAPASRPVSAPSLEASETMKGDVERSWETIQELGTAVVGERIYRIFFDMVPEAVDCFPAHVRHKYREWTADESDDEADLRNSPALRKLFAKVLNAVGSVVAGLQDSSKLVPLLTSLGGRHIVYNTNEAFWPALGKAVMLTLAELLGDGFTSEVENAWNVVFGFTSSIMIAGLRQALEVAREGVSEDGECAMSQKSRKSQRTRHSEDPLRMTSMQEADVAEEEALQLAAAELDWHRFETPQATEC